MSKRHTRRKKSLPTINSMVTLQSPHKGEGRVLVGLFPDTDEGPEFKNGTVALIVDHRELQDGEYVPMILVEGVVGWIFNDEWIPVEGP